MATDQLTPATPKKKPPYGEYSRRKRLKYIAAGRCATCGRERDRPTSLSCNACHAKASARGHVRRAAERATRPPKGPPASADMPVYKRAWRAKHKASGLCTSCGHARDVPGRSRCAACVAFDKASRGRMTAERKAAKAAAESTNKAAKRLARKAFGLCGVCGGARGNSGTEDCSACLSRQNKSSKERYRRLKDAGLFDQESQNLYGQKRRARLRGNGGVVTIGQWRALKRLCGHRCLCCGLREPVIKLAMDHVVPIAWGGLNIIQNAQPLCKSCNSRKGSRHQEDYRTLRLRNAVSYC